MSHYLAKADGKEFDVNIERTGENYEVSINGKKKSVKAEILGGSRMLIVVDNQPSEVDIRTSGYKYNRHVFVRGAEIEVEIQDYRLAQAKKVAGMGMAVSTIKSVKAPMPGLILEIKVSIGQKVRQEEPLVVIEAMKMENIIKSPVDAVIKEILATSGKSVEKNDILIEFE